MYRKLPLVFFFQAFVCLSKCCLFQNDGCQTQPGHNNQVTMPFFWFSDPFPHVLNIQQMHPCCELYIHILHLCVRTECSQVESR